ncbi:MAG TPA: hypothetical protein DHV26_13675, partial [Cytophagales bacterium]|nr:hypothetical protein [Cytophagales bacterium]
YISVLTHGVNTIFYYSYSNKLLLPPAKTEKGVFESTRNLLFAFFIWHKNVIYQTIILHEKCDIQMI